MNTGSTSRAIAEIIFFALNNRDLSLLEEYLDEEVTFDFPGTPQITGRKRVILFFKVLFRKYPRLIFTVKGIIAEGERACALWTNRGESSKGLPYTNSGATYVETTNGKIVFLSDYFKDTSFAASD